MDELETHMCATDSFQEEPSYFCLPVKFRLGQPKLVLCLQNTTVEPPQNDGTIAMVNIPNIVNISIHPPTAPKRPSSFLHFINRTPFFLLQWIFIFDYGLWRHWNTLPGVLVSQPFVQQPSKVATENATPKQLMVASRGLPVWKPGSGVHSATRFTVWHERNTPRVDFVPFQEKKRWTLLDSKKKKKEEYQNIGSTYFFHLITPKLWGNHRTNEKASQHQKTPNCSHSNTKKPPPRGQPKRG